ncbi:hypothetical protein C0213_00415 [Latilactobacillus sakei]|nr:hypothetical protein [Latilactobacillus sakei]AUX10967.1 hypothetical protein C0213_00415 [Latilactobacillus sakei]
MNKKLMISLATATLLLLVACGQQADSTKTSSNSHKTAQSEKRAKKQSESKLRAQSSAKKQASKASAKAMSESREKAAVAASTAAVQSAEAASSAAASEQAVSASSASVAQQASATAASKVSESQQAAKQAKQSAIKPVTQAEAIEAAKKVFNGIDIIVSHNGTFSSQPDGSMTAHDYSGAQGEDFWTFTPNADGTITVLSKFGSVKGGEQQSQTHVVPR